VPNPSSCCGDGVCDYVEATRCSCPADCGNGQGLPPPGANWDDTPIATPVGATGLFCPGQPGPGQGANNLPAKNQAASYCPKDNTTDGLCIQIVSEGRADGNTSDPDCTSTMCSFTTENLTRNPAEAWVDGNGNPPKGCGSTGQVFKIGYPCTAAGAAAAQAWVDAWCGQGAVVVPDPGLQGVCNVPTNAVYQQGYPWDLFSNADSCVNECQNYFAQATVPSGKLNCQNDGIAACNWFNACRNACVTGQGSTTTVPAMTCAARPAPVASDGGLAAACSAGYAQANGASVSTYGVGLVTCYNYGTFRHPNWGPSGEWQTQCTNAANQNYPALPANAQRQIDCCMQRMGERCKE
jgi:hypothetical protein